MHVTITQTPTGEGWSRYVEGFRLEIDGRYEGHFDTCEHAQARADELTGGAK